MVPRNSCLPVSQKWNERVTDIQPQKKNVRGVTGRRCRFFCPFFFNVWNPLIAMGRKKLPLSDLYRSKLFQFFFLNENRKHRHRYDTLMVFGETKVADLGTLARSCSYTWFWYRRTKIIIETVRVPLGPGDVITVVVRSRTVATSVVSFGRYASKALLGRYVSYMGGTRWFRMMIFFAQRFQGWIFAVS